MQSYSYFVENLIYFKNIFLYYVDYYQIFDYNLINLILGDVMFENIRKYNFWDGQEIKRPLFLGLKYTETSLDAMSEIVGNIEPNKEVLTKSMLGCPGLFAAHKAFEKVKEGMTFRDAYREIGSNISDIKVTEEDIDRMLKMSVHQGGTGNLGLDKIENEIKSLIK